MTTPTPPRLQMPIEQADAVPANPHSSGLYTAATVNPDDQLRLDGGIEVTPINCGPHGTWPTGCGPLEDPEQEKAGQPREARKYAPSLIVWASDDCGLIGSSEEEARTRALQLLRLYEQIDVEEDTAVRLLAEAGTPATAPTAGPDAFAVAVGAIEAALGLTGMNGVIHAARSVAALAAKNGLIVQGAGGRLTTPLGNTWAFGAGYGALANRIVGTGPVTVRRGPIATNVVVEHRQNERTALAERHINVSWECATVAQATG